MMNWNGKIFPDSVRVLIKRLGIAAGLLSLTRIVFYLLNTSYFKEVTALDFLLGLRFDASVLAYFLSMFILLSLIPFSFTQHKVYERIKTGTYFIPLGFALFMNLADAEYYKFIFRRSTFDVVRYFSSPESDGWRLLPQFARDFWYVWILFILLMLSAAWLYKRAGLAYNSKQRISQFVWLVLSPGFIILAGRGGLQLTPISLIDAGLYTSPSNVSLVLNSSFSFMITAFQQKQDNVTYFENQQELKKYYSVDYRVKPASHTFKGRNVVLLILESFGQEYIGFYKEGKGYTPFLDSLLRQSYVYINAFANGKQSIDALPALLSGIPVLMQDPFTYSTYSGNRIPSLASYFKTQGYRTQFFHGGANGTMGFESFCGVAGVDEYFGLDQYPRPEKDYDGNWGIFDEPYLKYCNTVLSKNEKPFFSTIFTLSSHHPYKVPDQYKNRFPKGTLNIHESIGYADYALQQFFAEASKQDWFKNTLFVITADHTAQTDHFFYQNGMGMYAVPIAFYDPLQEWKGIDSTVIQHVDLFPTLMALTGAEQNGKFFGRSALDQEVDHTVLNYNFGTYCCLKDSVQLLFRNGVVQEMYAYPQDSLFKKNQLLKSPQTANTLNPFIRARIQSYYQHMEDNTLYFDWSD